MVGCGPACCMPPGVSCCSRAPVQDGRTKHMHIGTKQSGSAHLRRHARHSTGCIEEALQAGAAVGCSKVLLLLLVLLATQLLPELLLLAGELLLLGQLRLLLLQLGQVQLQLQRLHVVHVAALRTRSPPATQSCAILCWEHVQLTPQTQQAA